MNKNQWLILIVVVLVAAAGYWLMEKEGKFAGVMQYSPTPSSKAAPKSVAKATPVAPSKSYTEMVKEYEGRRIQFDQYCQAVPKEITYKNGTSVMLDNRSGDARSIKVGNDTHSLAGYGYKIVNLSRTSLPSELLLSCGSAVNVGKILLQAQLY